jgi:hypothetical protein
MAVGKPAKQVPEARDACLGRRLGQPRPDPLEDLQGDVEDRRPRPVHRSFEEL